MFTLLYHHSARARRHRRDLNDRARVAELPITSAMALPTDLSGEDGDGTQQLVGMRPARLTQQLVGMRPARLTQQLVGMRPARLTQQRRRNRRHRSRNCHSFRLYGSFFHLVGDSAGRSEPQMLTQLQQMQSQVDHLLQQRDLLMARMVNTASHAASHAMAMTSRFYELFSHGLDPINHPIPTRHAEEFLRSVMVPNAVCTEFIGVKIFLQQYKLATANHASFRLFLKGISLVNSGHTNVDTTTTSTTPSMDETIIQVKANATVQFRISRETIKLFFPSIVHDEELTQQLIGKEYEMQYDKVFHFANGRIFQHESRIEMCTGLLQMVGNPVLAVKLFQAARLSKHGHWLVDSQVAEDKHQLKNSAW